MSSMDDLYQELILDHSRHPRHFGCPARHTHDADGDNPLCGDHYHVYLTIDEDGTVKEAAFAGSGCAISKASASMMTDAIIGKSREEVEQLFSAFHALVQGPSGPSAQDLGKLNAFAGVWKFPARVKCAVLCWHAVRSALSGRATACTEGEPA